MISRLNKEQIEDLVTYCGSSPTRWRSSDMQICCPVHGESNPSMGVSEELQMCNCFSCGFHGDFAWLLFKSRPDDFKTLKSARDFLKDRYELEYRELAEKTKTIKRYEDTLNNTYLNRDNRHIIPMYKIAPFMSGKETYKYYFDRGFDKEDMQNFMIGRDIESETVTIPAFYEDGELAGVIGRYISSKRKKNERYKIYDFPRGEIMYPMNLYSPDNGVMILVEGMFDAQMMHKYGYHNTLAKMGVELTKEQAEIVCENCHTLIYLNDNDDRGFEGRERDKKYLGNRVKFLIVDYPEYGKDPCDWSKEDIDYMISNAHSPIKRKLRRL